MMMTKELERGGLGRGGLELWLAPTFSLAGKWHIRRTIRPHGRFNGDAHVELLQPGHYFWRERGEFHLATGSVIAASRDYTYLIEAASGMIQILYADGPQMGEMLHRFQAYGANGRHRHLCSPDQYEAKLLVETGDRFQLSYAITGPRKNYSISSICTRA